MKILDRLPIPLIDQLAFVGTESVRLKKTEIIVWMSIGPKTDASLSSTLPRFPAILDTGHTHNFAIRRQHLIEWAQIEAKHLRHVGHVRHMDRRLPLFAANLWLHRNIPQTSEVSSSNAMLLDLPNSGIAVYPDGANYPRLPLLGLRALLGNQLHLTVDGKHAFVNLRTPDWQSNLLRLLI